MQVQVINLEPAYLLFLPHHHQTLVSATSLSDRKPAQCLRVKPTAVEEMEREGLFRPLERKKV